MARGVLLAVALVVVGGIAPAANAQDASASERAEKLFLRGEKMFSLGRFQAALRSYRRAFEAEPHPEFLFNIAQCYWNLGDSKRAVQSYRRYLTLLPNAPNRVAVERIIKKLDKAIAEEARKNPQLVKPPDKGTKTVAPPGDPKPRISGNGNGNGNGRDNGGGGSKPFYKRWQFWTGVAVVGVAGGGTTWFLLSRGDGLPAADGTLDFGR